MVLEILKNNHMNYLNNRKIEIEDNIKRLKDDDCNDEANLEKVSLNVVEIFITMMNVAEKKSKRYEGSSEEQKYEDFCKEYLEIFNKITSPWRVKLIKSKECGMLCDVAIEEIKLNTANEIKIGFENLMQED